jgi:hypothetical protein
MVPFPRQVGFIRFGWIAGILTARIGMFVQQKGYGDFKSFCHHE